MIKIILVRHGQTIKNKEGVAQGHNEIDVILSSSLGRAIKTAKKIGENHKALHVIEENLKELSWGDFASLPTEQLLKKWSEYYDSEKTKGISRENIRPKNGENTFDHIFRVQKVMAKIIQNYKDKTILIVAHGGTNKVLIGLLKKLDPDKFYTIKQDNACINLLKLDNEGKLIDIKLNSTEHLK
jgi:probable phosphoglycerate mutase